MKTHNFKLWLLLSWLCLSWSQVQAQCPTAPPNQTINCGQSTTLQATTSFTNYQVVASSCPALPLTGTDAFPTACDDCVTGQIPIGFSFNFFGNVYNTAVIQSNGIVGFGPLLFTGYDPFAIPSSGDPLNYIAGLYADIDINNGGAIRYRTEGTAPNRRFVVSFDDVAPYGVGNPGRATFQIILNENNTFEIRIISFSADWTTTFSDEFATSGAENIDGSIAFVVPGRNYSDWRGISPSDQDCHIFQPIPCNFLRWQEGSTVLTTSANLTISPPSGSTTTYTAYWNCGGNPCSDNTTVTVGSGPTATGAQLCLGGSGNLVVTSSCSGTITGPSIAQNTNFNSGDLTASSPTWTRPNSTNCSSNSQITAYHVFSFEVSTAGSYTFNNCMPNSDGFAFLYQNNFDPTNRCPGFMLGNDDGNDANCDFGARLTANLSPGITYFLISTTWGLGDYGAFFWQFTGPAGATISPATPAPAPDWYTSPSGGSPIGTGSSFNPVGVAGSGLSNTNTAGTTTFYAACPNAPSCRTAVDFVINENFSDGGTIGSDQTICGSLTPAPLTSIAPASGASATPQYQWQSSSNNGSSWGDIGGATNETYNPTGTTTSRIYRRGARTTGCSNFVYSNNVTVTVVTNFTNAGTIASSQTICQGTSPSTINSSADPSGGSGIGAFYQWQSSPDGSSWTDISGANSLSYTPPSLSSTTHYRRAARRNPCANFVFTPAVVITVIPNLAVTPVTICQGGSGSLSSAANCSPPSISQNTTFNQGSLVAGSPTWVRPIGINCSNLSSSTVRYAVFTFQVSANGNYIFNNCMPTTDGYGFLYQNGFDPASQCTGFITGNDDGNGSNCSDGARLNATLSTGITYYLISTVFGASHVGAYSWQFTGPAGAVLFDGAASSGDLEWYDSSVGGSLLATGSSFNPVGVAGSGLSHTNTAGTSTFYLSCSNNSVCRTPVDFVILPNPNANISGNTTVCEGNSTSLTASGGGTYVWTTGATTASINVSPNVATTYQVTVSQGSCSSTASFNLGVNTSSTPPNVSPPMVAQCPNTDLVLSASGGIAGTGASIQWYDGPNGSGNNLGSGPNLTVFPQSTTTYYLRREGLCGSSSDASVVVPVKDFVYALNGTSTSDYCTDRDNWHHFFVGDEIILSVQGDLSAAGAGFPIATIRDNGSFYQNPALTPSICNVNFSPGEERFEMARSWDLNFGAASQNPPYHVRFYHRPSERAEIENAALAWLSTYTNCGYQYKYTSLPLGFFWFKNDLGPYAAPLFDGLHLNGPLGNMGGTHYVELQNINSFSGGSGGVILVPDNSLPIQLLSFQGRAEAQHNHLFWTTASERDNLGFYLERSSDGLNFESLGFVPSQGNSVQNQDYAFDDHFPNASINYYRLRQNDVDGQVSYSRTIALSRDRGQAEGSYRFFPNPNRGLVYYEATFGQAQNLKIEVSDVLARTVQRFDYEAQTGLNLLPINLDYLPAGSYFVRVISSLSGEEQQATIIKANP